MDIHAFGIIKPLILLFYTCNLNIVIALLNKITRLFLCMVVWDHYIFIPILRYIYIVTFL